MGDWILIVAFVSATVTSAVWVPMTSKDNCEKAALQIKQEQKVDTFCFRR